MFLQTFIVVISPLLFAGIAWYFIKSRKELQAEEKLEISREIMHDQKIKQEELDIRNEVEESKHYSEMIVKLSEKIALELLTDLETALGKKHNSFESVVPSEENFEAKITEISTSLKSKYIERIVKVLSSLKSFEHQKAHNIIAFSDEQIGKTEEDLKTMRNEEFAKVRERIDRYKNEEIKLLDRKIKTIIDEAVIEVLGKALSSSEQEELIIKALENAKKNNEI